MNNDIENRLRRDGAVWRENLGTQSPVKIAALPTRDARRHLSVGARIAPALAAVAVVAVVSLILLLVSTNSPRRSLPAASGVPSSSASPTRGLPTAPASSDSKKQSPAIAGLITSPTPSVATQISIANTDGLVSMPWGFVKQSADGLTVDIIFVAGDGSCTQSAGTSVIETAGSVEIFALSRAAEASASCPASLAYSHVEVRLSSPLGDRTLLHSPVDSNWANTFPRA